ncbi:hypothetical protein APY04_0787 [Hyphomicrobium sulfonivorans]|uniref:Uncharacterized protein n=1 Tax=Hyphomicrobium sulfonivorans TaxID=121290 RepID=A0A109BL89_HYPSL|nr:hypothetical protein [Hyphomicrobium sulfonivorans]KWT70726.1 hypothetical protein APY04_0787 [Hyphomicrobium sulfonivorans]
MITLAKLEAEGCAVVRIRAELNFAGCFVAHVHGWAASVPDGDALDRVFVCEDGDVGDERAGPELVDWRDFNCTHSHLERAISKALWEAARHPAVASQLRHAQATRFRPDALPRFVTAMAKERQMERV